MTEDHPTEAVRLVITGFGIGVFTVGIAALVDDSLVEWIPVDWAISVAGNDYFVLATIGAVALILATAGTGIRLRSGPRQRQPPAVEGIRSSPRPGAEYDTAIDRASRPVGGRDAAAALASQLQETAVETVMRTERYDRDTAERRLDAVPGVADLSHAGDGAGGSRGNGPSLDRVSGSRFGTRSAVESVLESLESMERESAPEAESEPTDRSVSGAVE